MINNIILKNSKKWDHTATISAYYLSSLTNDEPKDLLKKVFKHISNSVQKRLDQKETRATQIAYIYGNGFIPLPLGKIKLERVNVPNTSSFEETGFHLLNWLDYSLFKNKSFLEELSRPTGYGRCYSAEEIVLRWKVDVREHLEKHLYEPALETEKRRTRSTQKLEAPSQCDATLSKLQAKK